MAKPAVFLACSTEDIATARAIQAELDYDTEITIWNQDFFVPSEFTLESLTKKLHLFDFAIFVMAPDDIVSKRGRRTFAPRDNVVFELGLFIGRLGRDRCFIVVPRGQKIGFPTDLLGVTVVDYAANRSDGNLRAALGPGCNRIRSVVAGSGTARLPKQPPATGTRAGYLSLEKRRFIEVTLERLVSEGREKGTPSLIFVDLDRFDAMNRWYGDEICDAAIASVEKIIVKECGNSFVARMGGDQFLVCRFGLNKDRLRRSAERVADEVREHDWARLSPDLYVTISLGIALWRSDQDTVAWILRAVHGCIRAKRKGGNMVMDAPINVPDPERRGYEGLLS